MSTFMNLHSRPPGGQRRLAIGLLLVAALISTSEASPAPQAGGSESTRAFVAATREYAQLHRRLEQDIGPIEITTSIDEINRRMQQMAAAIRSERPDAKQGDLFAPALGHELRVSIDMALRANDFHAAQVISASRVDGIDYGRVRLRVNDTFPWALGVAMLPCIIEALPPLPPELQYRIVGADLVLIDVHASLIVDILPSALFETTVW